MTSATGIGAGPTSSPVRDERREGYDVDERAARLAAYPLAAAAGAEIFANYYERFEDGLRLIVAGVEVRYGVR
ncbi:TetR/AcrR family transcriptional regulator C-terminal domain-containing protein [Streptomyces sp. NPDC102437]|uniref:TetR/AcrR family transcriptional regulator C-terminal domain-containing protein n=1 Tax=Streptomyces sp. NPDC102437 TaxID=3366175 RepID=UPI00382F2586